jgi:hypothetical protein
MSVGAIDPALFSVKKRKFDKNGNDFGKICHFFPFARVDICRKWEAKTASGCEELCPGAQKTP